MAYEGKPSFWRRSHLGTHLFGLIVVVSLGLMIANRDSFLAVSNESGVTTHGYSSLARGAVIVLSIFTALYAFVAVTLFFNFVLPPKPTLKDKLMHLKGGAAGYVKLILKVPCILVLGLPSAMSDFASVDSRGVKFNRDQFWLAPAVTEVSFDSLQKIELKGPTAASPYDRKTIVLYLKNSQVIQAHPLLSDMEGVETLLREAAKKHKFTVAGKW